MDHEAAALCPAAADGTELLSIPKSVEAPDAEVTVGVARRTESLNHVMRGLATSDNVSEVTLHAAPAERLVLPGLAGAPGVQHHGAPTSIGLDGESLREALERPRDGIAERGQGESLIHLVEVALVSPAVVVAEEAALEEGGDLIEVFVSSPKPEGQIVVQLLLQVDGEGFHSMQRQGLHEDLKVDGLRSPRRRHAVAKTTDAETDQGLRNLLGQTKAHPVGDAESGRVGFDLVETGPVPVHGRHVEPHHRAGYPQTTHRPGLNRVVLLVEPHGHRQVALGQEARDLVSLSLSNCHGLITDIDVPGTELHFTNMSHDLPHD